MICPGCVPWNAPLAMQAPLAAEGHAVPLRYEGWLLYHLHVIQHQAGSWAGEIDRYTKELLAQTETTC